MKGGAVKCEVMNKDDIDSIRRRSKAGSSGPWVTDYNEMAKKTVFRRATKWLPLSAEIIDAFERDFDSPDFVEAAKQQANSLEALTLRLESRDPEPKPEPEAASSEPHAVSDLEEIRQEILAADAEKVAKLYDFYVGPNGPLGAADTSQVSAWCKSRSAELAKAGKSSGVLFDDGMSATEAGM